MATRSTIAIQLENGSINQVYCHWDGYLSNNGKILMEYYNNAEIIKYLNGEIDTRSVYNYELNVADGGDKADTTVEKVIEY